MIVFLDGEYLPQAQAKVSVNDRGFLFGDGVYEVVRAYDGRLFEAEAHLERLEHGLRALAIDGSGASRERLYEIAAHLLHENRLTEGDATVYLQITRGAAPRTHAFPPGGCTPTLYVACARFVPPRQLREEGAAAITHPDLRWSRCDLKTVNLLPNCLAKQRAVEAGAFEAILIRDGVVTEGASSNAFAVVDGELRTYPKSNYILPGITRDVVLRLAAEQGIPCRETPVLQEELAHVDELFLTGTTTDVQAIVRLDGRPVGDGRPGPVARALRDALMALLRGEAAAVS